MTTTTETPRRDVATETPARTRQPVRGMIRQGDVLLIPRRKPKRVRRVTDDHGRPVPALVVGTDHHHVIRGCRLFATDDDRQYVFLERPETLTHCEHRHVDVAAGWYEVRQQREREFSAVMARRD